MTSLSIGIKVCNGRKGRAGCSGIRAAHRGPIISVSGYCSRLISKICQTVGGISKTSPFHNFFGSNAMTGNGNNVNLLKLACKNSWNHIKGYKISPFHEFLGSNAMIGNGNNVNLLKLACKISWNHIKGSYFWRICAKWKPGNGNNVNLLKLACNNS